MQELLSSWMGPAITHQECQWIPNIYWLSCSTHGKGKKKNEKMPDCSHKWWASDRVTAKDHLQAFGTICIKLWARLWQKDKYPEGYRTKLSSKCHNCLVIRERIKRCKGTGTAVEGAVSIISQDSRKKLSKCWFWSQKLLHTQDPTSHGQSKN